MKLLLDTHSLLWWVNDDPRLGPRARSLIADPDYTVLVSAVSFWEASIKHRIGKLPDRGSELMATARENGFEIIEVTAEHLRLLEEFEPKSGHKDPFDLIILVQAQAEGAVLVTSDRAIRASGLRCL